MNRNVARWAVSVVAAYALALHVLLASALMASTPPRTGEICFGVATEHDAGDSKGSRVHCSDCIIRDVLAPAPPPAQLAVRADPHKIVRAPDAADGPHAEARRWAWRARAPPIFA